MSFLQHSTYSSITADGLPLIEMGFAFDITNYKEDSRIIHKIESLGPNCTTGSSFPIFTSVHYPGKQHGNNLSKRKIEILKAIYKGMCSKEIADMYCISINTINNHRKNMLQKTNTKNSSGLIGYALKNRIL